MWTLTKFIILACAIGPNLASETDITDHCNQNDPIAKAEQAASIVQQGPASDASIAMASEEEDSDDDVAAQSTGKKHSASKANGRVAARTASTGSTKRRTKTGTSR
eukprot:CAMPEP_0172661582 /NCGR_PEP_ID=MMETSP1074-20121228/4801_1 /TAXON_ID=2916 /ORGANISM="Ceratium fusus, Strain PA161109" /LENGTH=105 /DNA_ID=CAMNT_0013477373 /DNA_START=91 /DNA_END=408 /DNA_ORIENTATION=+